jgi:uncharacterized LabA/DUF88 family protein
MIMAFGLGLGLGIGGQHASRRRKMDTKYLFIDGGCLRATLNKIAERYFDGRDISIDYGRLKSDHKKAFYYDAIPTIKPNETEADYVERVRPRIELHNHIATISGYHVYEGDSRIRRKQVQQKEVDVMIAVDMLTHTFRGNMDRATLIASDIDFKPLLDALVREGMFVELRYPPTDTNQDLVNAADQRTPLGVDTIFQYLDAESQKLIKLPNRAIYPKDNFDRPVSISIYNHPSLGDVQYFIRNESHHLYWGYPDNIDCFLVVDCDDYDFLRKYVDDLYLINLPEKIDNAA